MIRHRRHWTLQLLMLCAFAAVITRALAPVGYMVAADGDRLSITLCGSGARAAIDLGDDHPTPKPAEAGVCAFAVAAVGTPLTTAPALDVPALALRAPPVLAIATAQAGRGLAAPPPPARGPPALV